MFDPSTLQAAVAGFQAANGMVKSILELRDTAKIHEKIMELRGMIMEAQGQAISAQAEGLTLVGRIRDLEAEIVKLKDWDRDAQRYELKEPAPGVFTYAVKEAMRGEQPAHQLCAHCYQDRFKSILNQEILAPGMTYILACDHCGAELVTSGLRQPGQPKRRPGKR